MGGEDLQFLTAEPAGGSPAATTCAACGRPIGDAYFEINGLVACPECRAKLDAAWTPGGGAARLAKAAVLGVAAGAVGAGVWYGVMRLTDATWGLIAVGVGFLVGLAVRKGSEDRGGAVYQLMAVGLTWLSITMAYATIYYPVLRADDPDVPAPLVAVVAFVSAIIHPFAQGVGSILGVLIIGFALWEAFRLNRRAEISITGPHRVQAPAAAPPPLG